MIKLNFIITISLCICVALTSGLLFAFSIAVSPGLRHVSDIEFIKVMKNISREILNPLFFICYFGPLLLFPIAIYFQSAISDRWLLIIGFIFYLLVIGITATINVPLNNRVEQMDILHTAQPDIAALRHLFEHKWTYWNNIRSGLSTASLICLLLA